jgi:hypothetical protein
VRRAVRAAAQDHPGTGHVAAVPVLFVRGTLLYGKGAPKTPLVERYGYTEVEYPMATMQPDQHWRSRLTRDIGWLLLIKLGLLTLLWALFFSGSHRCRVDGPATANRLALADGRDPFLGRAMTSGGDRCD